MGNEMIGIASIFKRGERADGESEKLKKLKIEKPSSVALDGGKIFFVFVRLLAPDEDLKL